jgi:hypothetical protein
MLLPPYGQNLNYLMPVAYGEREIQRTNKMDGNRIQEKRDKEIMGLKGTNRQKQMREVFRKCFIIMITKNLPDFIIITMLFL